MPEKTGSRVRLYRYGPTPKPKSKKMENREPSSSLYHTYRWEKLSKVFRQDHPLCEICKSKGITRASEVTDHIIPWPVCKDFYNRQNLQALCQECNRAKGNRDKAMIQGRERPPISGY